MVFSEPFNLFYNYCRPFPPQLRLLQYTNFTFCVPLNIKWGDSCPANESPLPPTCTSAAAGGRLSEMHQGQFLSCDGAIIPMSSLAQGLSSPSGAGTLRGTDSVPWGLMLLWCDVHEKLITNTELGEALKLTPTGFAGNLPPPATPYASCSFAHHSP